MIDFENIENEIKRYKNLKITRPSYKKAFKNKKVVELAMHNFIKILNYDFLSDDQKKILETKINNCSALLFTIQIYIIKCKTKFDME